MPVATGGFDEDSLCRLQLEVHWNELRRVLPNILNYQADLEKCIDTSDLNELNLMSELMELNVAAAVATPEQREQLYGLNDMIFEKLHESRRDKKYPLFCKLLEDNMFTEAMALLRRQKTPQERQFFNYLAEYYRTCLVGDGKSSAASDGLVNGILLTTLRDFGVITEQDADDIADAGDKKMPALLSVLLKNSEWPAKLIIAIVFSEGNCSFLEQLLPGFEDFLILRQGTTLEKLRDRLGEIGSRRDEAERLVKEAFDLFLVSNTCAFEEPLQAGADHPLSPPSPRQLLPAFPGGESDGDSLKAAAEPTAQDKRRLLVPTGGYVDGDTAEEAEVAEASAGQQMRAYQLELAAAGLAGRNTVIVAPTGSGKTLVGIAIAAQRLRDEPGAKIVFLADRTQLVDQQYAAFKQGLPAPHCDRVICVRGGSNEPFPISYCLGENSVLVLSTQILLNNLTDNNEDGLRGDIAKFRLLIFDECHHCDKEHPSKKIMDLYFKYRDAHPTQRLPQIVGLTASPGTGQARDQKGAVEHVLKICANLACEELCTVRNHVNSLRSFVPNPSDQLHWAGSKPYDNDMVLNKIDDLMLDAETLLITAVPSAPHPPSARGSFMYTNYCGQLHQMLKKETKDHESRALYAAWRHLSRYNFAHLICSLFRSIDAVTYLHSDLSPENREPTCELDVKLTAQLASELPHMDEFCARFPDAAGSSPALDILMEILCQQFEQNSDSRVIVFVQQRCFTRAVKDFLDKKQPPALARADVRAAVMTGANACGAVGGITPNAQTDTLADFRRGVAKILVSTSVSEEGLDVQKCNKVVRFCHVTNEIAMVQSKGRGRAEGSTYHVIVPNQLHWLARKEKTNKMRDELMQKAVIAISDMRSDEFNAKMQTLQNDLNCMREVRDIRAAASARAPAGGALSSAHYKLLSKCCNQLICTSLDLRLAEKHYIVLQDDLLIEGRAKLVPRDGGSVDDLLGCRLICARCSESLGGLRKFKTVVFPWLSVSSFKFVNVNNNVSAHTIRKWTDTAKYFVTAELSNTELRAKAGAMSDDKYMQLLAAGEQ